MGEVAFGDRVFQMLMYAPAPFFFYPWKPLAAAWLGARYVDAYAHFRRDHQCPSNLAAHTGCLAVQLGANFALLSIADRFLVATPFGAGLPLHGRLISIVSAGAWTASLLIGGACPISVKAASAVAIGTALTFGTRIADGWGALVQFQGLMEVLAVQTYLAKEPIGGFAFMKKYAARRLLQMLIETYGSGVLEPHAGKVNLAVAAFLGILGAKRNPTEGKPVVFHFAFVGWILAMLTNQPALFFLSSGFVASLSQGVSHENTGERATLTQLNAAGDGAKYAFEWGHTLYFPNLLLHSIYQSVTSGPGPAP